MNYLYTVFLITLLLSVVLFYLEKKESHIRFVRNIIFTSVFSFVTSILFLRLVLSKSIFIIQTQTGYVLYNLTLLVLSICLTLMVFNIKNRFITNESVERSKWKQIVILIIKMVIFSLFIVGLAMFFAISWSLDFYGELKPEQFLYNISAPSKGTNIDVMSSILHTPLLIILSLSILFLLFLFMHIPHQSKIGNKLVFRWSRVRTMLLSFISIAILVFGLNYSLQTNYIDAMYNAFFKNSNYIQNNYVNPKEMKLQFPEKKRNLIHIYAESIESSYLSKELGGFMDENLMPNLTGLAETNIHFSDSETFGGWNQTYASSWSIAGIVNMENGVPLKISMDGNSYGKEGVFLPGITNIGDILEQEGYNQMVMLGSDASFAGRDTYFTEHGSYSIFDVKEARKQGVIPEDYNVWWGFEDDKLYQFAKPELTRLYEQGQPFHFNMITADTHFPGGYVSEHIERKRDSQYADVIAYSDAEIVSFIKWVQNQPFYENTTIVITGDHLSMDKTFFKEFSSDYQRRPFNLFINAPFSRDEVKRTNRSFSPVDMFPTMISSLGVEIPGDRLGLGTDLFSGEQTLIERDGLETFNRELSKHSYFYDIEFLKKSDFSDRNENEAHITTKL